MTLGVAVVGLGVGEAHARAYAALSSCRVVWLHDLDVARAARVAADFPDAAVAPDWQAIVADRAVDVVSIASYDDAHAAQVTEALSGGKHVFVEKPLCRTLAELRRVKQAWRQGGGHLGSNLVLRTSPAFLWLKEQIRAGRFGEVYAMDGDYLYGRLAKITDGWRADVEDYSVLTGGGIHLVDLLMWLTAQRPARVAAWGNRVCSAGSRFAFDDYQAAVFRFDSPLIGRITANFGCVHPHQHVLRIFGERATFIHDDQGPRLFGSRDAPAEPVALPPLPASKGDLIPQFVDRIIGQRDGVVEAQHELDVVAACVAADGAARKGETVDVEYV